MHPNGSAVDYASYFGGKGNGVGPYGDTGIAVAVDSAGHAFITGQTFSDNLPTSPNALQPLYKGNTASSVCGNDGISANHSSNAFVAEFDVTKSQAASLLYATYLGGTGASPKGLSMPMGDTGTAIAVTPNNQVWVGGITTSCDLPSAGAQFQPANLANQKSKAPATAGFLRCWIHRRAKPASSCIPVISADRVIR